MKGAQNVHYPS